METRGFFLGGGLVRWVWGSYGADWWQGPEIEIEGDALACRGVDDVMAKGKTPKAKSVVSQNLSFILSQSPSPAEVHRFWVAV